MKNTAASLIVSASMLFGNSAKAEGSVYSARDLATCAANLNQNIGQQAIYQSAGAWSAARARFLPTVSVVGAKIKSSDPLIDTSGTALAVNVQQTLFSASALSSIDAEEARFKTAKAEVANKSLDLALRALEAVVANQRRIEQRKLVQTRLDSYALLARILSESQKVGLSDSADAMQASSAVLTNQLLTQQTDFEISRARADFQAQFGFPMPMLTEFEDPRTDVHLKVEKLPELESLKFQISQSHYQQKQLNRSIWPELSLQGSYRSSQFDVASTISGPVTEGSVRLVFDLSGLWANAGRSRAFDAIQTQQLNLLERTTASVRNSYEQLSDELELLDRQLITLEQRVQLTSKAKELTKVKVQLGKVSFYELQLSEDNAFTARYEYTSTVYRRQQIQLQAAVASLFAESSLSTTDSCRIQ